MLLPLKANGESSASRTNVALHRCNEVLMCEGGCEAEAWVTGTTDQLLGFCVLKGSGRQVLSLNRSDAMERM